MIKKHTIEFIEEKKKVEKPITKFGDAGMGFFFINMKDGSLKFIIESC